MTPTLYLCVNRRIGAGSCSAAGAWDLLARLRDLLAAHHLDWDLRPSPCLGHCAQGPNVKAAPGGPMLHRCTDAADVLRRLQEQWPAARRQPPIR